jgi:PAS domain S-box-containing protein
MVNDSDKMRTAREWDESAARYKSLFDYHPDAVYSFDCTGRFTSINDSVVYLSGYSREELLEVAFDILVAPEYLQSTRQYFMKALAGEPQNYESIIIKKNGRRVFLNVTNVPIIVKGEVVGVYGIAKDITANKVAEETLKETTEKYRQLFDLESDAIFLIDNATGRILEVNMAASSLYGYTHDELLRMTNTDLSAEPSETRRVTLEGQVCVPIRWHRKKDGTVFPVEITARHFVWGGSPVHIAAIRDITERKQVEEERLQSFANLRKALSGTIQAISLAVETRDPYTAGHQRRVADLARSIASAINLRKDQIEGVRMASMIHDIGKIAIPAEILSKPTKLTEVEFSLIKIHPRAGYDILKDIEFPWPISRIILEHHERMDGSGYPNGLTGKDLLIESKILSVADSVEAIASHRPYRPALGVDKALEEIERYKGAFYDHAVVDACQGLFLSKKYQLVEI